MALGDNDERDEYEKAGKVWRRLSAHWWEMSKRFMTERDDFKVRLEGSRNMVDHVVAERDEARRRIAELEATVANLDPRIARLERITGGDPIQGVEDMWWIGCESWFAWEDGDE